MKEASMAYKASKNSGEILPPPPAEFFDKKTISKLKRLEKQQELRKPCKPPQVRNPETGRCKQMVAKPKKEPKPCKPPQTRNPKTGRCKNMGVKQKKEPKPCKPPRVRNPDTGRCKKPQKEVKKRQPTAWDLHLKKVRAENPSIKGKQIMILAKESYNKPSSAKPSSAKPSIKIVDFQEPELNEIEDPFLPNPKNNNNDGLMDDIMESFQEFVSQMERVANDNLSKKEKQDLFNNIISKVGLQVYQIQQNYGDVLSIAERQEITNGYKYIEQIFDETFGMLVDGAPEAYIEIEGYEEDKKIDKIILDSLEGENEPLFNQPLSYTDLIKYDEPPPLFRVPERSKASDYVFYPDQDEEDDIFADEIVIDDEYDDNIYDDLPSPIPELLVEDDENLLSIVSKSDIKDLGKGKKKLPLGLRIYQEYLRLFKIQFPDATRDELNEEWKENKDYYTELIMEMTDLSGGDMSNEDHLFNVFRNVGGVLLNSNMKGGAFGNKYYQAKNKSTYGNKYYQAKNPMGRPPAKALHKKPDPPSKISPAFRKNSPVDRVKPMDRNIPFFTPFLGIKEDSEERRLDNAGDWLDTFADIAKGTFTGVKTISNLINPWTWFL